jgi:hypothetical protein
MKIKISNLYFCSNLIKMKILFLIVLTFSITAIAQPEGNKKSISGVGISFPSTPNSRNTSNSSLFAKPLDLPSIAKPNPGFSQKPMQIGVKAENKVDLTQEKGFVNPNIEVLKQQNEKFKHYDLGSLVFNGNFVRVKFRDFSSPDGDMVRIMHNREPIVYQVILEPDYKEIRINLTVGENNLEILALNEGASPPNTAEFEVFDETGKLIFANQWSLMYGEIGEVKIKKEK